MTPSVDGQNLDARELLARVSRTLGLEDESQDWGIVNADAGRLDEFIRFLTEGELAPTQIFELVELILASANERLVEDPGADLEAVAGVLARHPAAAEVHGDYWRGLSDDRAFPIGAWLRAREPR